MAEDAYPLAFYDKAMSHLCFLWSILAIALSIYEFIEVLYGLSFLEFNIPYPWHTWVMFVLFAYGSIIFKSYIRSEIIVSSYGNLWRQIKARYLCKACPLPDFIGTNPGFVYVMRRSDGIYKLGRSDNPNKRLKQHQSDYGMEFELIKRFVVPDVYQFEGLALRLTSAYNYTEPGRVELRQMTTTEADEFITKFEIICKRW